VAGSELGVLQNEVGSISHGLADRFGGMADDQHGFRTGYLPGSFQ
jgi:hypothetical protein